MERFSDEETAEIARVLTSHLRATATKNISLLRKSFTDGALFVGTDDTEQWPIEQLAQVLEKSKAGWNMTEVVERSIYKVGNAAAFFEVVVHESYGAMRGSGVVTNGEDTSWKIALYVLSFSVPNRAIGKTNILELLAS